ncbi:Uncharacterised protein [Mycolicibacterium aurum]|uniref:Transmembrane protein n=2 Tax=Mycolicibacterium aurum TaxID=1791 RepID=A0A448IG65_MYCAU|nr:Uncharacterised protein [Mycolicibacterium aurum]
MAMLSNVFRRLLDGDAEWGSLTIQPDRFGTRYLLVVYPPGITARDRRLVRLWRGWPVWGAVLWVLAEVTLLRCTGAWTALAVSTGILLGTGVATRALAGELRAQVRCVAATLLPRHYDPISGAACAAMAESADRLREARAWRIAGLTTPAEFETTWWKVYDSVGALASTAGRSPETRR